MVITDNDAISEVGGGKTALSAGYTTDIEERSGVWLGVAYDVIQRNIRYNHVSIEDRGRAGDMAVMKTDSADGTKNANIGYLKEYQNFDKGENTMSDNLKKIRIDGVEYEGEQKLIDLYTQAKKDSEAATEKVDSMKVDLSKLEAENDQLKADKDDSNKKLKKAQEKIDELESGTGEHFEARLELLAAAKTVGAEVGKKDSAEKIKRAIILARHPEAKEKLEKCDSAYLEARYDTVLEAIKKDAADESDASEENRADAEDEFKSRSRKIDPDKARNDMIATEQKRWEKRAE